MKRLLFILLVACSPESITPIPEVSVELLEVTDKTAHVKVTSPASEVGVTYGLSPTAMTEVQGEDLTLDLVPNKIYFLKGFAKNEGGTGYSDLIQFHSVCPSELGGTIGFVTAPLNPYTQGCLPNHSGITNFIKLSNSQYEIGDASFGIYDCAYGDSPATGIIFEIVCGKISILGEDQYGFTYSWTILQNNDQGLYIQWENSFGDKANTKLTKAGGWPELWQ